jgi:DNA-binding beta-propeller fold protein YncE
MTAATASGIMPPAKKGKRMIPVIDPRRVVPGWGFGPGAPAFGLVSTVATDSRGNAYVLCRTPWPAMHVFEPGGRFLRTWTEHAFVQPHGLWIAPDDRVYTTDTGDHTVRIFTAAGELVQTIGTPGETGAPGMPFNAPTRVVAGPSGDLFVSDGYGQNRIHRFSPDGRLRHSWGEPGSAPGQFDTPHSLWVDERERVYVVDRGNGRIQVFAGDGAFVAEWAGFRFPHDVFITAAGVVLVTDCAPRVPDATVPYHQTMPPAPVRGFTRDGISLGGTGAAGAAPGQFLDCPHSLWIDRHGDVYVGEVVTPDRLQKFAHVSADRDS